MVTSAAEPLGSLTPNIFNSLIYDYKHTVKSTRNGDFRFRMKSNQRLSTLILVVNYNLWWYSFTKKIIPTEKNYYGKHVQNRKTENPLISSFFLMSFQVKY